jgi:hypothetical protein
MSYIETVKVKDDKAPGGYVVINKSDFDPKRHKEYVEPKSKDEK